MVPLDTTLNRVNAQGKSKELASLFDYETDNNPDDAQILARHADPMVGS